MEIVKALVLMLVLGGALGFVLGIASVKFYVEVDTRVEDLLGMLPGYNCGACGNAGCSQMAEKLINGEADIDGCKPCKADAKAAIRTFLQENCSD